MIIKHEATIFSNYFLIIDADRDLPLAVEIEGIDTFWCGDAVIVTPDIRGYICPGIKHPGYGIIEDITRDDTDHFFGVRMDNGEFGYVKVNRIKHI